MILAKMQWKAAISENKSHAKIIYYEALRIFNVTIKEMKQAKQAESRAIKTSMTAFADLNQATAQWNQANTDILYNICQNHAIKNRCFIAQTALNAAAASISAHQTSAPQTSRVRDSPRHGLTTITEDANTALQDRCKNYVFSREPRNARANAARSLLDTDLVFSRSAAP